jgi:hypothetical protein
MKKIRLIILLLLPALFVFSCEKENKEILQDYTCVCTWQAGSGNQTATIKIKNSMLNDAQIACSSMESNYIDATCSLQ